MRRLFIILFAIPLLMFSSLPISTSADEEPNLPKEIIYDILVDRFNNGRQAPSDQVDIDDPYTYNGGDIKGVTKMLDTLEEHGFTTISLSPIMENAQKGYHGYWIEDFYEVEEEFGSIEDLQELVEKAHKKDMKVMIELVTNYVAKTSPLVDEEDKQDWFLDNEVAPIDATKWLDEVYVLDQTNSDVEDYLIDVATYWMDIADIDGFKLHAADQASPLFLEKLTQVMKEKDSNFYVIATTLQGNTDVTDLLAIDNIDAVANEEMYDVLNEVLTEPDEPISKIYDSRAGEESFKDLLYVDNMNTARFSNNFADNGRNAATTWTLALAYLYLTPGVPILYQGSEVPMYGPGYPENQYMVDFTSADPEIEKVFERISSLRDQFPQLVYGDFEQVAVEEGLSLFKRTYDGNSVYVAINNDSHSHAVSISGISSDLQLKGLMHDDTVRENDDGEFLIGMERESAEIFMVQPNVGFNWGFIAFVAGVFIIFIGAVVILSRKQRKRESTQK